MGKNFAKVTFGRTSCALIFSEQLVANKKITQCQHPLLKRGGFERPTSGSRPASAYRLRYLGHNTLGCVASPMLCR